MPREEGLRLNVEKTQPQSTVDNADGTIQTLYTHSETPKSPDQSSWPQSPNESTFLPKDQEEIDEARDASDVFRYAPPSPVEWTQKANEIMSPSQWPSMKNDASLLPTNRAEIDEARDASDVFRYAPPSPVEWKKQVQRIQSPADDKLPSRPHTA